MIELIRINDLVSVCFEQLLCMKNHIFKLLFLPILFISCNDNIENPDYLNDVFAHR